MNWKLVDFFCGLVFFVMSLAVTFSDQAVSNNRILAAIYIAIGLIILKTGRD